MSKKDKLPTILIIGSDSLIGGSLMNFLQKSEEQVVGTTRRDKSQDKSRIYLDLSENVDEWRCLSSVSVAVICAGVTKIDACKREPFETSRVNVQGIFTLAKNFVRKGTFVIYLSTNQVFDGSVPYRLPDAQVSPITEYGRQKAKAEHLISQLGDSVAIIRFTKVLGAANPLFSKWRNALKNGETIQPFSNMSLSPVPVSFAVLVLSLVVNRRLPGILQVSGNHDISYAEAAYLGAKLLGVESNLVQPVEAFQSGCYIETIPPYTTLNIDRLKSTLGIEPPDVRWTIEMAFTKPEVLGGL
jgi:dTDP-4-dehydrorhamnose reductase